MEEYKFSPQGQSTQPNTQQQNQYQPQFYNQQFSQISQGALPSAQSIQGSEQSQWQPEGQNFSQNNFQQHSEGQYMREHTGQALTPNQQYQDANRFIQQPNSPNYMNVKQHPQPQNVPQDLNGPNYPSLGNHPMIATNPQGIQSSQQPYFKDFDQAQTRTGAYQPVSQNNLNQPFSAQQNQQQFNIHQAQSPRPQNYMNQPMNVIQIAPNLQPQFENQSNLHNPIDSQKQFESSVIEDYKLQNNNEVLPNIQTQSSQEQDKVDQSFIGNLSPDREEVHEQSICNQLEADKYQENANLDDIINLKLEFHELSSIKASDDLLNRPALIEATVPINIHPLEDISILSKRYKAEVNICQRLQLYQRAVYQLKKNGFTHLREVRGDGNCYYRSVAYQYIETLTFDKSDKRVQVFEDLFKEVQKNQEIYHIDNKQHKVQFLQGIARILENIKRGDSDQQLFNLVQRMFILNSPFDKAMIYFIRCVSKNFLQKYSKRSLNGLPLEFAASADAQSLDEYIADILMKMETDAQGPLLYIIPIVLRINIYIVNIDTSANARINLSNSKLIKIEECSAQYPDICLKVNDNLNFHDKTLYVLRKDGHYDSIYSKQQKQFENIQNLIADDKELLDSYEQYKQQNKIGQNLQQQDFSQTKQEHMQYNSNIHSGDPRINIVNPKDDTIYLKCCGNSIDIVAMQAMFQPENGQEWFVIEDKFQQPACPVCSNRMKSEDLLRIFPEQAERIRELYKDNIVKIQKDEEEKKQVQSQIVEIYEDKIKQKEGYEKEGKCSKCQQVVNLEDQYHWPSCLCLYHKNCVYEMVNKDTQSIFFAFSDKIISQIKTFCLNQNCSVYPPAYLAPQECEKIYKAVQKDNKKYQEILEPKNHEIIQMECQHKLISDVFKNQIEQGINEKTYLSRTNSKGVITLLNILESKLVEAEQGVVQLKCIFCEVKSPISTLFQVYKMDNFQEQDAFKKMLKLKSIPIQFKCFHCIASLFFNSHLGYKVTNCKKQLSQLIREIETDFCIDNPGIKSKIVEGKLIHEKDFNFNDKIQEYFKLKRKFCEHNKELIYEDYLQISEIQQTQTSSLSNLIQFWRGTMISGSVLTEALKYYPTFFDLKCSCGTKINHEYDHKLFLCPKKCQICEECFQKQYCIGCKQQFSETKTFCFQCKNIKEENEITQFIESCEKTQICLDCFSAFIITISDTNKQTIAEHMSNVLNCQMFQQKNEMIVKQCEKPHWLMQKHLQYNIKKAIETMQVEEKQQMHTFHDKIMSSTCTKHALQASIAFTYAPNVHFKKEDLEIRCISCLVDIFKDKKEKSNSPNRKYDQESNVEEHKQSQDPQKFERSLNENKDKEVCLSQEVSPKNQIQYEEFNQYYQTCFQGMYYVIPKEEVEGQQIQENDRRDKLFSFQRLKQIQLELKKKQLKEVCSQCFKEMPKLNIQNCKYTCFLCEDCKQNSSYCSICEKEKEQLTDKLKFNEIKLKSPNQLFLILEICKDQQSSKEKNSYKKLFRVFFREGNIVIEDKTISCPSYQYNNEPERLTVRECLAKFENDTSIHKDFKENLEQFKVNIEIDRKHLREIEQKKIVSIILCRNGCKEKYEKLIFYGCSHQSYLRCQTCSTQSQYRCSECHSKGKMFTFDFNCNNYQTKMDIGNKIANQFEIEVENQYYEAFVDYIQKSKANEQNQNQNDLVNKSYQQENQDEIKKQLGRENQTQKLSNQDTSQNQTTNYLIDTYEESKNNKQEFSQNVRGQTNQETSQLRIKITNPSQNLRPNRQLNPEPNPQPNLQPEVQIQKIPKYVIQEICVKVSKTVSKEQFFKAKAVALTIQQSKVILVKFSYSSLNNNKNYFLLDYYKDHSPHYLNSQASLLNQIENIKKEGQCLQNVINQKIQSSRTTTVEIQLKHIMKGYGLICSNCFLDYPKDDKFYFCKNLCLMCETCQKRNVCSKCQNYVS